MNLEDFAQETRDDLDAFRNFWLDGHAKDSTTYPLDLPPGDWFDQFLTYLAS